MPPEGELTTKKNNSCKVQLLAVVESIERADLKLTLWKRPSRIWVRSDVLATSGQSVALKYEVQIVIEAECYWPTPAR